MSLNRGVRRVCAIALTAAALIVIYLCFFHWWLVAPLQTIAEEESALMVSYERFARLEAQRDIIQAQLKETQQRPLPKGSFLVAPGAEAATAQLMQVVSSRIAAKPDSGLGCSITNRLPQAPEAAGEVLRIQVDVELECGIESLTKTLYRMETESPYLKIDALSIRKKNSAPNAQFPQSQLGIKLQVSGFLKRAELTNRE